MEIQGRNLVNTDLNTMLKEQNIDTLYLHLASVYKRETDVGIFASALYTNLEGSNSTTLVGQSIKTVKAVNPDYKFMAMESYHIALQLVYEWQNILYSNGIQNIVIVTDIPYLYGVTVGDKKDTTGILNTIYNKYFSLKGTHYINLNVFVGELVKNSKAKKYCSENYTNLSNLKLNNLGEKVKAKQNMFNGKTVENILAELDINIEDLLSE